MLYENHDKACSQYESVMPILSAIQLTAIAFLTAKTQHVYVDI